MRISDLMISAICAFLLFNPACQRSDTVSLFDELEGPRSALLIDDDWQFYLGDIKGAEEVEFDDSSWRALCLPHDWSIEDISGTGSPLDSVAPGGISTGYFRGGTGWYRKNIYLPSNLKGKRFFLEFEGIYMNADIWINGVHLGNHPYGYTSFWYELSDQLHFGRENLIAVRVRNEGRNSRWYTGSGIYRHVWLTVTEPVYIAPRGTCITTPEVANDRATVLITNEIFNTSKAKETLQVESAIYNQEGSVVASRMDPVEVEPGNKLLFSHEMEVANPRLWSVESPDLYKVVTKIGNERGTLLDLVENSFGIRTIEFTSEGFFLNGQKLLMKGGCMHHDNGPLGAAAYDRAEERRVELMKASGFNAIRCAHNPPSPAFLDACDRIGMLIIDEAFDMWKKQKNPQDYHLYFDQCWEEDIRSMVLRDRNHPSIIMWSTGNEIPERGESEGVETSRILSDYIRRLDPTRPVTSAVNGLGPDKDPYFSTLDISGYNYSFGGDHGQESIFTIDHARIPERIMYCSESYPLVAFGAWMDVLEHPYVVGDFVWTGFDYLGEASIGWLGYPHEGSFYPWNHAYCGDIDICGMKRPQSYYRNVLWNSGRLLSLFVKPPEPSFVENPGRKDWSKWHWQDVVDRWNWPGHEGTPLEVEVYSAHEEVELFLNGTSLGKKPTNRGTQWIARWKVPYSPGELKAVAYDNREEADSWELVTAGSPEKIALSADRTRLLSNGQDLSFIIVELHDGNGERNTLAEDLVEFEISGPGTIVAVGSSNPMSTESFQQPRRRAYQGRCLVVVKSGRERGEIRLTASVDGLDPSTLVLETL
jgi:beta-galactosidase